MDRIAIKYHKQLLELARLASLTLHDNYKNGVVVKMVATKLLAEIKEDSNE